MDGINFTLAMCALICALGLIMWSVQVMNERDEFRQRLGALERWQAKAKKVIPTKPDKPCTVLLREGQNPPKPTES